MEPVKTSYTNRLYSLLIKCYIYYALLIGATPFDPLNFSWNYKPKRYVSYLQNLLYCCILIDLPYGFYSQSAWTSRILSDSAFAQYVALSVNGIVVLGTMYLLLFQKRINAQLLDIKDCLHKQFSKIEFPYDIEYRFLRIFYCKYALTTCQLLTYIIGVFTLHQRAWNWNKLTNILFAIAAHLTILTLFKYFLLLWTLCRYLTYMNSYLAKLFDNAGCSTAEQLLADILHARSMHKCLICMIYKLNSIFCLYVFIHRCICFLNIVLRAYLITYLVIWKRSALASFSMPIMNYFIIIMDIYILDLVCQITKQTYKDTCDCISIYQVRQMQQIAEICDCFVLHLRTLDFQVIRVSIFPADKSGFFRMLASALSHLLILLQVHIAYSKLESIENDADVL